MPTISHIVAFHWFPYQRCFFFFFLTNHPMAKILWYFDNWTFKLEQQRWCQCLWFFWILFPHDLCFNYEQILHCSREWSLYIKTTFGLCLKNLINFLFSLHWITGIDRQNKWTPVFSKHTWKQMDNKRQSHKANGLINLQVIGFRWHIYPRVFN